MLYITLMLLSLSYFAEALPEPVEEQVTQVNQRNYPNSLVHQRSLLNKITYLQRKNDELSKSLQEVQIYRDWIFLLEKRIEELEQIALESNNLSGKLQTQINQGQAYIQQLTQEQTQFLAELQKCHAYINQIEDESQQFQKQQELDQKEIQESSNNFNKLKETLQTMQTAIDDGAQKLQQAQETISQLQQENQIANQRAQKALQLNDQNFKKNSEQISLLTEQLQSKTKKIKDLYSEIDALNVKFTAMNKAKTISEQQLKRLEASEASCQKALKASIEKETLNQSSKKDTTDAINKWRKEHDQLKAQLDVALSINKELREQNAKLEKESKSR